MLAQYHSDEALRHHDPIPGIATPLPRASWVRRYASSWGWTFLWAFLDKLFGLGYATPEDRSWVNGGSTTRGFLENSATGPFEDLYRSIAGDAWADGCS